MKKDFDSKILKWKLDVSNFMKNNSSENGHTTDNEETESAYTDVSDDQASNVSIQKDLGNESDVQQTEGVCHMYDITFDNVNQRTHSRVYSLGKSSTVLNMVQAFACKERIPTGHLSDIKPSLEELEKLTISNILPSESDENTIKSEMGIIIKRILVENMKSMADVKVDKHIKHEFSAASNQKSEVVSCLLLYLF
jgi:hypothetical protein